MGKDFPHQTGYEPQQIFEKDGILWSTLPGSIGYLIGSNGEVIGRRGKPLIGSVSAKGYPRVKIFDLNNKQKTVTRHRLVAEAFIPNPLNKPQVNHIDADKSNNCISNLEWVTNDENHSHKMRMGLNNTPPGEASHRAKMSNEDALCIYMDERDYLEISEEYGVSMASVYSIKGRRSWRYITEGMDAIGYSFI